MHAAVIESTGPAQNIHIVDMPVPVPQPGEVLIKVGAVSVNPVDTYIRAGSAPQPLPFPYIIGCDFAGVVDALGDGVTEFQIGDRVWGSNQGVAGRQGTFAELICVHQDWCYPTPQKQSDESAAAGALVGLTAQLGLFERAHLQANEVLFINGGSGGVGSSVIQFAKASGAKVITTAGSPEKRDYCKSLGADAVLDYHDPELDAQITSAAEALGGLHLWWETLREPDFDRVVKMLSKSGRMLLMAGREARPQIPVGPFYVKELSLIGLIIFNHPASRQKHCARRINVAFEAGQWTPLIGRTMTLDQAAAAHALQEDKTLHKQASLSGKIVLTM